ncbi:helix-hairpin-helix domain-containing protein [Prolixibacteraceae bacterium Z1-6]|uniref:Helix-hairpin-helix domain-containing protein n=1 Tax=Draconibacterium aestuarii TaxID=2998507 RepID=A0A9X3J4I0_9BACT|nr:helix-hairpin-helix domain-containing protein [Prolixibacteraceae bacterium Z1-6]
MKKGWAHITIVCIGFLPLANIAQETNPDQMIEAIIESHLDKLDEGTDVALIIEDLERLAEHPININATSATELSHLYILNDVQIQKLLDYVINYGPAYTIYELNTIDGFTPDILQKMQPFIRFGKIEPETKSLKEELKYGRHQWLLRGLGNAQKAQGYKPKEDGTIPYEGNRARYYMRYNFQAGDRFSAGLTAEKDPGEAFFRGSNKHGFDFYSGHFSMKLNKTFEHITLGDYLVRSGQGLVLWQGYTSGKSEDVLGISKIGHGVRSYTSVDENLYFRGAATTLNLGRSKLSLFYSQNKVDGNLAVNDSIGNFFTSLQTSGYHRTESEIADEKTVNTANIGGIFTWQLNHLKIGTTFLYQRFDKPFIRSEQLYNRFRFSGQENYTGGIDYLFSKGKYQLFGEAALSKSKGKAVLQGAIAHLNDQLSFSLLLRHFNKDYHALWANTFAEGSQVNNESGLYLGTKFLPVKHISISAYSDIYRSNWINYSTAGPSKSWDIFMQADFRFSERYFFYIRFKNEEKEQKFKENRLYVNLPERTQKSRFHFQYKPVATITLKTRLEHVYYKGQKHENGYLVFQDVQYSPQNMPLNLTARIAWFSTESYDSRIYAYENDILYTFSIPAFYGNGFRTYLNLKYKITDKIECWAKLANTHWTDRETISSGLNELNSDNKTELKFQLRLKF